MDDGSKSTVVCTYYQYPPNFNLIKTDNWLAAYTVTSLFNQQIKRDKFMYNSLVHGLKPIQVQLANMYNVQLSKSA